MHFAPPGDNFMHCNEILFFLSIGLDALAAAIQEDDLEDKAFARLDVLIHVTAVNAVKQVKLLELANQLWCRGIRCSICDPGCSMDDVQDQATETGTD